MNLSFRTVVNELNDFPTCLLEFKIDKNIVARVFEINIK